MAKITLIGSSHIARDSVKLIRTEILKEKPELVAVELDQDRMYSLFNKETKIKLSTIKKIGLMGFLFTFIGKALQDKLGKLVGITPGSDIRSAIIYGKEVGATICLIDKNIKTIAKDISNIPFFEKIKIIGYLLGALIYAPFASIFKSKKGIDISKVPSEQIIEDAIKEFKEKFPKLYDILIESRNKHMASILNFLGKKNPDVKIIAVVGAGHISGIKDILKDKYSIKVEVK